MEGKKIGNLRQEYFGTFTKQDKRRQDTWKHLKFLGRNETQIITIRNSEDMYWTHSSNVTHNHVNI